MSKLSELQGKSKTYTIGPIELTLKPLSVTDMDLFNVDEKASSKEQMKSSLLLIDKVLLDAVPDSTPEERKDIKLAYMEPIMKAIMDVNGMNKEKTVGALDAIKARQAQIKT
jgi:hypothetical protein